MAAELIALQTYTLTYPANNLYWRTLDQSTQALVDPDFIFPWKNKVATRRRFGAPRAPADRTETHHQRARPRPSQSAPPVPIHPSS